MPPRKRAAAAPKTESEAILQGPGVQESRDPSAGGDGAGSAPPEPAGIRDGGAGAAPSGASASGDAKAAKSEVQGVDQPCTECFPNGWPAAAFAVGCKHGTWARDTTD